jgi:hypothetical protein
MILILRQAHPEFSGPEGAAQIDVCGSNDRKMNGTRQRAVTPGLNAGK